MKNYYLYLFLCALLVGLCLLPAGAISAAAPDAWQLHDDPLGFSVRHPPNWSAEVVQNELISVRSADGKTFVLVQPFFARDGVTAESWVGEVPEKLAEVLPNAKVGEVRQVSHQPDEVIAELTFDNHSEPGRVLILCVLDGRSGMLYGVAAPARTFDETRPVLIDVLGTFSFTTPAAPAPAGGGTVSYVKWQDPNESAFALEAPQGWQVTGGLHRENALDVRPDVQITSPHGQIFVRIGDQDIPRYLVPTWALDMTGSPEDSWYSGTGMTWMVRSYVSGLDFAKEYLTQHLPDGCGDANITDERDRPDLAQPINDVYASYKPYDVSRSVSIGQVAAECQAGEQSMFAFCFACTELTEVEEDLAMWQMNYLFYGTALANQQETAKAILGHVANSYEPNWEWLRGEMRRSADDYETLVGMAIKVREIMRKALEEASDVRYDFARHWSNMILGMTDVRDPATGEEWRVANGHNYYWRKGDTAVGTGIDRPDVDFTPLAEF